MATNDPNLIQNIICGICEDRLTDPKISGECNHTYCKKCLQGWMLRQKPEGTFTCPHCRAIYKIPENGAAGLRDNEKAKAFIEELEQSESNKGVKVKYCDPCKFRDISTKASHCCGNCDGLYLCNSCFDDHREGTETARHEIVEVCQSHCKVLKKYCLDCCKFACDLCVHFEHSRGEHHLKPYKDVLASAEEEQRKTIKEAKDVLSLLRKEKAVIYRVDDVTERKREFWFRSIGKNVSQKLLEYDREMARLQQERKECEEKGFDDKQTILKCCKTTKDTKAEITQLEHNLSDIAEKGEILETDRSEAYITLQEEFLQPIRKLMKEAREGNHFAQCDEMVKTIQGNLDRCRNHDVELQAASARDASVFEKIHYLDNELLRNLGGAISSSALKEIRAELTKYFESDSEEISGIEDVTRLWEFMQSHSMLATGCYGTLKDLTRKWIPEAALKQITETERAIVALAENLDENKRKGQLRIDDIIRSRTVEFTPECDFVSDVMISAEGNHVAALTKKKDGNHYDVYITSIHGQPQTMRIMETGRDDCVGMSRYKEGRFAVVCKRQPHLMVCTYNGERCNNINIQGISVEAWDVTCDLNSHMLYIVVRSGNGYYLYGVDEDGRRGSVTTLEGFSGGCPRVTCDGRGKVCVSEQGVNGLMGLYKKGENGMIPIMQRKHGVADLVVTDVCVHHGKFYCVGLKQYKITTVCKVNDECDDRQMLTEINIKDKGHQKLAILKWGYAPRLDMSENNMVIAYTVPGGICKCEILCW